jgi:hypothetical protein
VSTAERAQAYGRVVKQLDDFAGTKLHADEQAVIREAADTLLFIDDLRSDPAAERALLEVYELTDRLVDADRMSLQAAGQLVRDVEGCGPAIKA